jgi:hypothetical protein
MTARRPGRTVAPMPQTRPSLKQALSDRPPSVRAFRYSPHFDLGGGADAAQGAREEGPTNNATTEEVSK